MAVDRPWQEWMYRDLGQEEEAGLDVDRERLNGAGVVGHKRESLLLVEGQPEQVEKLGRRI